MKSFEQLADRLNEISDDAENDFAGIGEAELREALGAMFAASCAR